MNGACVDVAKFGGVEDDGKEDDGDADGDAVDFAGVARLRFGVAMNSMRWQRIGDFDDVVERSRRLRDVCMVNNGRAKSVAYK